MSTTITSLHTWLDAASITDDPVLRKISRAATGLPHPLHPESVNAPVQAAAGGCGRPATGSAAAGSPPWWAAPTRPG
jgi:hypothetical protein